MKKYVSEITSLKVQLNRQQTRYQAEQIQLETRYQHLVARFYHAQADYEKAVLECNRQRAIVAVKQEVITVLLPYYPHPITPELHYKIALI